MGKTKRHQPIKASGSARRATTRSSKSRLASDPAQNTADLSAQLRQLGLYAADTVGDGNCLFRALSDQIYGTEAHHGALRQAVCEWIDRHRARYEPFVEDERGIETHLSCMRQLATYGGHLELSAFAHMARRDVKVVQPGLVYVIEWAAGWDAGPPSSPSSALPDLPAVAGPSSRKAERKARKAAGLPPEPTAQEMEEEESDDEGDEKTGPVYVAYHDWEHFSSIRNLRGPHAGLPRVRERPFAPSSPVQTSSPLVTPTKDRKRSAKPASTIKVKPKSTTKKPVSTTSAMDIDPTPAPSTPARVPLPASRTPSPPPPMGSLPLLPSSSSPAPHPPTSTPTASLAPSAPYPSYPLAYPLPAHLDNFPGERRSPKRAFDESTSASSDSSQASSAKRARTDSAVDLAAQPSEDVKIEDDEMEREMTPALSDISTLSSSPSPSPPPPVVPVEPVQKMTRRQRKALGLPKQRKVGERVVNAGAGGERRSAGKIVIPGGRFRRPGTVEAKEGGDAVREWVKSGAGRVDVRGFRELKI
ncbi:cysteine proteinase [Peniophora sp. CONT]|nr:cysteine proteinase [Peniophora sp. CONT]